MSLAEVSKKVKNTRQNEAARKLKPSLIPMLKSSTRKVPTKEVSKSSTKGVSKKSHFEHNNVQRVQRLNIDHDTCPGITSPSKLVTTARPIPTLQHIYGQDLSNETFADWMLETVSEYQDAPEHLADSTSEEAQKVVSDCRISMNNANNEVNNLSDSLFVEPELLNNMSKPTGSFKSTNENVQDWLSTKLECPTRDNECGYQFLSRPSQHNLSVNCKKSCASKVFADDKFYVFHNTLLDSNLKKNMYNQSNFDVFLGDKPTVVINRAKVKSLPMNKKKAGIPKLNTEIKLVTKQTDIQIPFKYQSYSNPLRNMEYNERKTSSYVECPSEILQKTTNFDANVTDSFIDWSRLQKSHENTTNGKSSKTSLLTSERWQLSFSDNKDEQYSIKSPDKNSYHDYYHHYCWRKEVAKKRKAIQDLWDWKGRCTKCQRHRISPYQKKMPRSLKNLKRRMSIGRIVRRRWNCVWKKTAERWSNWSKPPYKFRKFRSVNLKKNSKWDDAVQTAIFVYNETGSSVRSTSFDKSYLRHANVGPSMFRFQQPSKFAGYAPSQSKATSYKSMRSYCYSFDTKSNECTFPYRIPDKFKNVESKNLSAIVEPSLIKSVDEEPKDAYTQMLITCNNAETNVKLTSDMVRDLFKVETCDDFVSSSGVDEGIQTLISSKSQRSIKTMTSMNDLQRFLHKEIQASPVPSIRKVSTFFGDDEQLEDAKSSVVTDTSLPYRRLNNKILTAKGTILTCTGTKITSVSSVHIQTASVISRTPKITMSTAVSTHLSTENRDCWTAPSFHLSNVEDVSMGTDDPEVNRSEKSTSYAQFTDYINAGISTSNLVQRISFNDGPHYTQDNFEAEAYPECSSICVNTDVETKPMSIETGSSLEFTNGTSKIDRYSQYSERSSNRSNR
ncbi:uncharacterized protein LOC124530500 [Vanessa cardui]|uniref:uncharacterized protein LOC124530500 n=1 Tax=Vanessa cardui TaxID=171605 RepID=UPI001F139ABF|nr:uncharacterized protein LOC124530500 [Vanessa cardui]